MVTELEQTSKQEFGSKLWNSLCYPIIEALRGHLQHAESACKEEVRITGKSNVFTLWGGGGGRGEERRGGERGLKGEILLFGNIL